MISFRDDIRSEIERIHRLIDSADPPEDGGPEGSLSLEPAGNPRYGYLQRYENGRRLPREYLGSVQSPEVQDYVSARFRQERLRRMNKDLNLLEKIESQYLDYAPETVLAALSQACQQAARMTGRTAYINQRYEELLTWSREPYERNTAPFYDTEIYAKDGTRVRSKGECLIYNLLLELGIPFRYDCVFEITDRSGNTQIVSPDFLIQCMDGSFIIIEHLGWKNGLKYGIDFGGKCYWYLQGGYVLGKNFFVTSDDAYGGTDTHAIEQTLRRVEMLFYGI